MRSPLEITQIGFDIINESIDRKNKEFLKDLDSHDCKRPEGCQCDNYDARY